MRCRVFDRGHNAVFRHFDGIRHIVAESMAMRNIRNSYADFSVVVFENRRIHVFHSNLRKKAGVCAQSRFLFVSRGCAVLSEKIPRVAAERFCELFRAYCADTALARFHARDIC